jgi:regulatory protein
VRAPETGDPPEPDRSPARQEKVQSDGTIDDLRARIGAIGSAGSTDRRRVPPPDDGAGDDPGDPTSVAKTICLRLLTGSARTRADLGQALRRRGIPDDVAASVLDRLSEVGLIDDVAYAEAFVASRHRDRGLGRSALRAELRRKGVDPAIAADAAAGIDDTSERQRAAELVLKRLDSAMFAGPDTARRRLLGYLARRGYAPGLAIDVVDDALRGFVPRQVPDTDDIGSGAWPGATWDLPESD